MNIDLQQKLFFTIYGLYLLIIFFGGIVAISAKRLIRGLLGLILAVFGVAGMYLLMAAPFVAMMQILIYVGAISVLIFFAIMFTNSSSGESAVEDALRLDIRLFFAIFIGLTPAIALGYFLIKINPEVLPLKVETMIAKLGKFLIEDYVLPFELISVVIFIAMTGAVILGFERIQQDK